MISCVQLLYTKSWTKLSDIVVPALTKYCIKHGYKTNIKEVQEPFDGFEKLREIKRIFENNEADVVLSIDCDALITNFNVTIESLISDRILNLSKDYNNWNCGVFIMQNAVWAIPFIELLLSKSGKQGIYCEQDAIIDWVNSESLEDVYHVINQIPQYKVNSYLYESYPEIPPQTEEQGQWVQGESFILHLPGIGMDKRIEILKNTKITL